MIYTKWIGQKGYRVDSYYVDISKSQISRDLVLDWNPFEIIIIVLYYYNETQYLEKCSVPLEFQNQDSLLYF